MLLKLFGTLFAFTAVVSYGHELALPLPSGATHEDINLYHFCRMNSIGLPAVTANCVASVKAFSGQKLVSRCFDQFVNFKIELKPLMHDQKSGARESFWHSNYEKKDKKDVSHRYDYSESLRELAGTMLGRRFYDALKRPEGANLPNQSDLDNAFVRGYRIGYLQPDFAGYKPDVYCEKGKSTCESSSGKVRNLYPNSNPLPVKPPENAVREDGALIKFTNGHGPAETQDQDPIESCIMKSVNQRLKTEKAIKLAPWGLDLSPEQKKASNRYLLKLGICDFSYWGASYCSAYNEKTHNFGISP